MASMTNLYVGSLPPQVDEQVLRQYFEPYGVIASIKIMREPITKASRCFGFVQYSDPGAAAGAVQDLNGAQVEGANILVKHADRNPTDKAGMIAGPSFASALAPTPPSDNVFVGGVPMEWSEADLNTAFGGCGPILSSVVLKDKMTGRNKGAGLVRFADVGSAMRAVQSLNGSVVEGTGRTLEVKFAERQEDKTMRRAAVQMQQMQQMRFTPYGKPGMQGMGMPAMPGRMPAMQGMGMGGVGPAPSGMFGQPIRVPKRNDVVPEEGSNLHVFGLDPNVTELHLYEAFAGYGAIRSVRVMKDQTGNPKGFGFVQYFNVQDAQNAMAALNGTPVGGAVWSVTVHNKGKGAGAAPIGMPRPGAMMGRGHV